MTFDDILAAAERLKGHARVTPMLSSPFLDRIAGRRVLVKAEALQKTGSFKYRGARAALSALDPELRRAGVIAYSSGNHAQGVAMAAGEFGVPAVIVMPADAPEVKVANTRALGAEVILYDRALDDRDTLGATLAAERGLTLIKPFDDPRVIAGQGSVGLEIAGQAADEGISEADVLVCCGGGGLTSGIALALEGRAPGLRARPVEPAGFDDVARSLAAGRIVRNDRTSGRCAMRSSRRRRDRSPFRSCSGFADRALSCRTKTRCGRWPPRLPGCAWFSNPAARSLWRRPSTIPTRSKATR